MLAIILCDSPCHKHLKNYLIIFLMLNVPFFFFNSVSLNLLTYAKQTNHHETKKQRKETENVINSDLTLGLKKRGDLANKTKALTKGERLKNGFGQWETLNLLLFHVSLICKLTHTSRAAHIAVKDKGKRSRASLCLCFWEKQKEGEQQQLLVGGGLDRASSSATQTDHSGKNASLVLVCWVVTF